MEGKKRFNNQASTIPQNNDKEWQQRKITQKSLILSQQRQEQFGLNVNTVCLFKRQAFKGVLIAKKLLKDWVRVRVVFQMVFPA